MVLCKGSNIKKVEVYILIDLILFTKIKYKKSYIAISNSCFNNKHRWYYAKVLILKS